VVMVSHLWVPAAKLDCCQFVHWGYQVSAVDPNLLLLQAHLSHALHAEDKCAAWPVRAARSLALLSGPVLVISAVARSPCRRSVPDKTHCKQLEPLELLRVLGPISRPTRANSGPFAACIYSGPGDYVPVRLLSTQTLGERLITLLRPRHRCASCCKAWQGEFRPHARTRTRVRICVAESCSKCNRVKLACVSSPGCYRFVASARGG
jgi:hypothetical protein